MNSISVIIPVFDDAERLDRCLDALDRQRIDLPFEVIVVDNGSATSPRDIVERHEKARFLVETAKGSYSARNAGLAVATGEVLAFTDSDCVPDENWLQRGLSALKEHPRSFIGGAIELFPHDEQRPTPTEIWELVHAFPQQEYVEQQGWAATANMLVRREDFDAVGMFNSSVMSGGDYEWGTRATASGLSAVFESFAVVGHPCRSKRSEIIHKLNRTQTGVRQLKLQRGEPTLTAAELKVLFKPPLRSLRRNLPLVQPPTLRNRVSYVLASYYFTYAKPLLKIRDEVAQRVARDQ